MFVWRCLISVRSVLQLYPGHELEQMTPLMDSSVSGVSAPAENEPTVGSRCPFRHCNKGRAGANSCYFTLYW